MSESEEEKPVKRRGPLPIVQESSEESEEVRPLSTLISEARKKSQKGKEKATQEEKRKATKVTVKS